MNVKAPSKIEIGGRQEKLDTQANKVIIGTYEAMPETN